MPSIIRRRVIGQKVSEPEPTETVYVNITEPKTITDFDTYFLNAGYDPQVFLDNGVGYSYTVDITLNNVTYTFSANILNAEFDEGYGNYYAIRFPDNVIPGVSGGSSYIYIATVSPVIDIWWTISSGTINSLKIYNPLEE